MLYTKSNAPLDQLLRFPRRVLHVDAVRIYGPFKVETREGVLECPDGYLAVDVNGWPYPIEKGTFEKLYDASSPQAVPVTPDGS